ncbi:4-azaleucine resistance probable transporter AzlC [Nocardioides scoriae]|uniref:4-azaleucine resistance probable transporter AzlC n=1 Tax=Nocardioides scoriae TaxID=642780 RepID=A0A1H1U4A0_9ACTN|nr:AzlC family ABC transporter permease [Nocardioides scoriae]SDS67181.1 4-azaleucine resistance probable transporter AzlC [Nocardioides scoriae]
MPLPDETLPRAERRALHRTAFGIGLYAAAFGATFGAVATGSGLGVGQTAVLSAVMFTGASQFAFVGVVAAGGSAAAAVSAALLLGARNAFYGIPVSGLLRPRGWRRPLVAHVVIDETTAMAVAQPTPAAGRLAFWSTALWLCGLWNVGTLAGALLGRAVDPAALGLDAAAPAVFLALLWPQLGRRPAPVVALLGAGLALVLIPLAPPGVPVVAAAGVALAVGLTGRTDRS